MFYLVVVYLFLPPILTAVYMLWRWTKVGRDPRDPKVVAAQFEPLKNSNPILCDLIYRNRAGPESIIATLIQLCISGHLAIWRDISKQSFYALQLLKPFDDLDAEQRMVVVSFFSQPQIGQTVNLLTQTPQEADQRTKQTNFIIAEASQRAVNLGYFATDPIKAQSLAVFGATYLACFAVVAVTIIYFLVVPGAPLQNLAVAYPQLISDPTIVVPGSLLCGLALAAIVNIIIARLLPQRTAAGNLSRDKLLGFRQFIQTSTMPVIQKLQAPTTITTTTGSKGKLALLQFQEPTLPYAIIFGLDTTWTYELKRTLQYPDQAPAWAKEATGPYYLYRIFKFDRNRLA
jgi:hypothetical protein